MNVLNNSYPCFSQNEGFIFVKQRQLKNHIFMGCKKIIVKEVWDENQCVTCISKDNVIWIISIRKENIAIISSLASALLTISANLHKAWILVLVRVHNSHWPNHFSLKNSFIIQYVLKQRRNTIVISLPQISMQP